MPGRSAIFISTQNEIKKKDEDHLTISHCSSLISGMMSPHSASGPGCGESRNPDCYGSDPDLRRSISRLGYGLSRISADAPIQGHSNRLSEAVSVGCASIAKGPRIRMAAERP